MLRYGFGVVATSGLRSASVAVGVGLVDGEGDGATWLGYMAHGGHGVISVSSNIAPDLMVEFYTSCQQGAFSRAVQIQDQLIGLHKALFMDASPAPTKYALSRLGLMTEEVRLPLTPCATSVRPVIEAAMKHAGIGV